MPPPLLFAGTRDQHEIIALDRICRVIHVANHHRLKCDEGWLFLNTDPRVIAPGRPYGAHFADLLRRHAVPAERVVVELLEKAIGDEGLLQETVEFYRSLGCLVAVDDFGSGHSNFDRIWRLGPDIVKLDRSLLNETRANRRARRMFPRLVSLIHEAGCLVVAEGVEHPDEGLLAMEAEVDMVQGFLLGRPAPPSAELGRDTAPLESLHRGFNARRAEREALAGRLARYAAPLDRVAETLARGTPLSDAATALMTQPAVRRCFLLTADGDQAVAVAPAEAAGDDPRFAPLTGRDATTWSHRGYFRLAIQGDGAIHTSSPYLSLPGAHLCVTLARSVQVPDGETVVLCCDLDWDKLYG